MHRCGRGIRFLSSSSNTRINWDPTVSPELNHPTLILLEKCCIRDHFKQILGQMMRTNLIGQTFPMSRLLLYSAISHPENLDMALLLFNNYTPDPNLYIYNTMINALSFLTNQSFALYNSMLQSGTYADKHTALSATSLPTDPLSCCCVGFVVLWLSAKLPDQNVFGEWTCGACISGVPAYACIRCCLI